MRARAEATVVERALVLLGRALVLALGDDVGDRGQASR